MIWTFVKEHALSIDKRCTDLVGSLDEFVQDVAGIDATGQVFRYPFDNANKKHLTEIGVISFLVLKRRFNKAEELLHSFSRLMDGLVDEYRWGTFTRKLSRWELCKLAAVLPPRNEWRDESFRDIKQALMAQYDLSSSDFSKALGVIQKRHEMAYCIGVQVPVPGLSIGTLRRFFDQWCKVNELKNVLEPPKPTLEDAPDLEAALADHVKRQMVAKALVGELSSDEFAAIRALLDFEDEAPVSEAFERLLSIYHRDAARHKANEVEYLQAAMDKLDSIRAFERILYSLDMLGQTDMLEDLIDRY